MQDRATLQWFIWPTNRVSTFAILKYSTLKQNFYLFWDDGSVRPYMKFFELLNMKSDNKKTRLNMESHMCL